MSDLADVIAYYRERVDDLVWSTEDAGDYARLLSADNYAGRQYIPAEMAEQAGLEDFRLDPDQAEPLAEAFTVEKIRDYLDEPLEPRSIPAVVEDAAPDRFHYGEVVDAYEQREQAAVITVLLSTFFESYANSTLQDLTVKRYGDDSPWTWLVEDADFATTLRVLQTEDELTDREFAVMDTVRDARNRYAHDLDAYYPGSETALDVIPSIDAAVRLYENRLGIPLEHSVVDWYRFGSGTLHTELDRLPDAQEPAHTSRLLAFHDKEVQDAWDREHRGAATIFLATFFEAYLTEQLEHELATDVPNMGAPAVQDRFADNIGVARNLAALDVIDTGLEDTSIDDEAFFGALSRLNKTRNRYAHDLDAYMEEPAVQPHDWAVLSDAYPVLQERYMDLEE